ncbi:ABC-F family ATP-binding cassette domain-containing protein [Faecalibaculum rodentium]|uniref:ATPase component of ABC transporter with duplicated ATPase domain n=3 Tax=Faecalibaculum rodentium TaxID=1702221 RepID=A0A140DX77_9FIRM|nr:ABC-F family ATP-binding cassette domain-containing protein [Faecalibaculum rodentium]AMK55254.1 ATPase component of ABC transporter with duplicated ATPase domain [Faecalibaculum rodentium]
MYLTARDITKRWTDRNVLDHIDLTIDQNDRIGLVGANGCGKSTLLQVLAGTESCDGQIERMKGLTMHYLPQDPVFSRETVLEEMKAHAAAQPEAIEEFEISSILSRLGLKDQPIRQLSGGQRKRLALAKALITRCQLLLLDEPTNHLDAEMIEWLENRLRKENQAVLMVTHDRWFLDRTVNQVLELDEGRLYCHDGGYESYLENKAARQEAKQLAAHKLDRLYKQELEWVRAGVQARSTKSRSRLDRFEELRKQRTKVQERSLKLVPMASRLGKKSLAWQDLAFAWPDGPELFHDVSYQMKKQERLGFIGPNGCGKSTLFKVLAGRLKPVKGFVETGETVKTGWFGQGELTEDLSQTVISYIEKTAQTIPWGGQEFTAAQMLEKFLIPRSMQHLPLGRLSGGERRRVYLLKVLMEAPNVLFLDEPTNDLDLVTLDILEDYLDGFPGIVLTVSHDRYFMDRVCDSVFVFQPDGTLRQYMGGYTEYREREKEEKEERKQEHNRRSEQRPRLTKQGLTYMEKKELAALPQQMEELQAAIDSLNEQMGSPMAFEELQVLTEKRDVLENELAQAESRWLELEEKQEGRE